MVNVVLELLITIVLVLKSILVAVVFAFIPAPEKSVKDDIVLITGAGSGIGRLIAESFARRGAIIVAWDVNKQGNEETAEIIRAAGGRVHTYLCDVSNKDDVYRVADDVKRDVGNVSVLINNAGIVTGRNFLDCPDDRLLKTMDVNVLAHFWTLKAFLPAMVAKNKGHVVTIASMAGIMGINGLADYCMSKFANVGFTESLALELAKSGSNGVKTTTICPYTISTGMFTGAKGRFPGLMPELTPDYATNRIVKAILTNQKILYMPRIMYILAILKGLLPVDASVRLNQFCGGLDFMTQFRGRGAAQNGK